MKKLLSFLAVVGLFAATSFAQPVLNTNTSPPTLTFGYQFDAILDALTTATNWTAAPYLTYVHDNDSDRELWGGGLAAVYNITANAGTMLRVDWIDQDFYMVSANLQLQLPFDTFNGNARMTPFGFTGAAYDFGGDGTEGMVGLVGAGWDIKFPKLSTHWSIAFDAEYWSDRPGIQWRFAPLVWSF